MWAWITGYRHRKSTLTRATAEAHLAGLRTQIAQVRGDLADLQDEVALILEDLDGVTRHVARVHQRLTTPPAASPRPATPAPVLPVLTPEEREALAPATFTATHRQRTEKETL